jgi:hypothetical protein
VLEELERRKAKFLKNPESGIPLEQVIQEIRSKNA